MHVARLRFATQACCAIISTMRSHYGEQYFKRHYSPAFYRWYIAVRNAFIRIEVTKLVPSGRFLEVGFGDGNLIECFKDGFAVFGVDVSEFAVKEMTKRYPPSHFKVCDVSKEGVPFEGAFDVICAVNTVQLLEDPRFALQNALSSLTRDGVFAVYLPTQSNIISRAQYRLLYDVEEHVFRPSVPSLRNLLTRLGLSVCKEYAADFVPLKLSADVILKSFSLYYGLWRKR